MLKLRLKKYGRKQQPSYRIVVIDSRSPRDGKSIEEVGFYNPLTKETHLKTERILHWLKIGIQPTHTVGNLLEKYAMENQKNSPLIRN